MLDKACKVKIQTYLVSEIFGSVWQGEGRYTGQACAFLRLSRCNLHCSFCDTPYSWAFTDRQAEQHRDGVKYDVKKETEHKTLQALTEELLSITRTGEMIVISGGEPMLQDLPPLVLQLQLNDRFVAIETAGTISPWRSLSAQQVRWSVSPKLANSGNEILTRYRPAVLRQLAQLEADFKFVITCSDDLLEVDSIVAEVNISPHKVWAMPEGVDIDTVMNHARDIAPEVAKRGWNLTLRQQVLMYGNERGR